MGQEAESGAANPLPAATSSRLGGRGNGNEATKHAEPAKQQQQQQQGNACLADGCREANRRRHRKYKTGAKGGEYSRVSTLVGILVDGCVRMGGDVLLERRVGSRCKERLGPPYFMALLLYAPPSDSPSRRPSILSPISCNEPHPGRPRQGKQPPKTIFGEAGPGDWFGMQEPCSIPGGSVVSLTNGAGGSYRKLTSWVLGVAKACGGAADRKRGDVFWGLTYTAQRRVCVRRGGRLPCLCGSVGLRRWMEGRVG